MGCDRLQVVNALQVCLEARIERLRSVRNRARKANVDAPGQTQSRYGSYEEESGWDANFLDARIQETGGVIQHLRRFRAVASQSVAQGSLVKLRDLESSADVKDAEWFLVLPSGGGLSVEVDGFTVSTISTGSPVGRVLLGHKSGDEVKVNAPAGDRSLEVLEVL